jgi:hypothetical protein
MRTVLAGVITACTVSTAQAQERPIELATGPGRDVVVEYCSTCHGTTASETLTEYTVGHSFAYEVTEFTNILGRLVEGVRGEWTFTPDGEGTVIRWTYEFKPLRGRYFLVRCGLAPLWRRYMLAGVEAAARACE